MIVQKSRENRLHTSSPFLSLRTGRYLLRRFIYHFQRDGIFQNETLIVGSNAEARLLFDQLANARTSGLRVTGYLRCGNCAMEWIDGLSCLGHFDDLDMIVREHRIRVVIIASSSLSKEQTLAVMQRFGSSSEVDLRMTSSLLVSAEQNADTLGKASQSFVSLKKIRLTRTDFLIKTMLDYCLTIPTVILLAPVFAAVAVAIKLDSRGPIIERRTMLGIHGKPFTLYTFRTTLENESFSIPGRINPKNTDLAISPVRKLTRFGRFMRTFGLHFLPQFFNVLRSDMSLVGSRLVCADEMATPLNNEIDFLPIQPGLTGVWHAKGCPEMTIEEQISLDMNYINSWTVWKDLEIIFLTFLSVFAKRVI